MLFQVKGGVMWFAGLLIGAAIGALNGVISAVFGAFAGAIAGAIIGAALKPRETHGKTQGDLADLAFKVAHIYKSLEDIHRRLVRLEKPGEQQAPETSSAAAVS